MGRGFLGTTLFAPTHTKWAGHNIAGGARERSARGGEIGAAARPHGGAAIRRQPQGVRMCRACREGGTVY